MAGIGDMSRIEAQFGLGGGSWIQRMVARALLLALGGGRMPEPQTSGDLSNVPAKSLRLAAGYDIAYFDAGACDGRLVVFVHGTPGAARGWADFLTQVPEGFRYIAIDRPGFAASGPDDAAVSLADQARAVAEVIRAQNAGPAILVGHSYGGPVVVQAAADAPEIASAVVVVAGALDPALEHIQLVQHLGDAWPLRGLLLRGLRNSNRELIALKSELMRLAPRLGSIKKPFVIVHGTADERVPFANTSFMKTHLNGATRLELIELAGQDHFIPWNAQHVVREAIARAARS